MINKYELITYSEHDNKILDNTLLTNEELILISNLKDKHKDKGFLSIIEVLYKFDKNYYSTSDLAKIFSISPRQIQRILKELELNKDKFEAQRAVSKRDQVEKRTGTEIKRDISSSYSEQIPERLIEFLNYISVIRGKSINTVAGYKVDITMFFRFSKLYKGLSPKNIEFENIAINDIEDVFIKKIKLSDFYAFLSFAENQRNNSAYARARKVAALKSFFKYLYTKAKVINENPTSDLETPKISKRNPVYLTLDESKHLLNSVDGIDKHSKRDFCIVTLFLNCGLRLSELCSIDISRIKEDTLSIIGKGNKERTIYLNNACLKAISNYLIERSCMEILPKYKNALFISERKCRINNRTVERLIKKHIGVAGLDQGKYTPHKLRHTAATLMYKYGNVDIRSLQKILGHENISTTQIYTHVDDDKLREAVNSNPLNN